MRSRLALGLASRTVGYYRANVNNFAAFANAHAFPSFEEAFFAFAAAQASAPDRSPNTVASVMRAIRAFASWLHDNGRIPVIPVCRCRGTLGLPKARDIDEIAAALPFLDAETALLVNLLLDTALRIGEVLRIRASDFDYRRRSISVIGKGGRPRTVGIGRKVALELQARRRHIVGNGHIFQRRQKTYRRRLRRAAARAGMSHYTPHIVRHSFVRQWFLDGGGTSPVQAMLGHATPTMTLHYGRIYGEDAVRLQQQFSLADRLASGEPVYKEE